MKIRGFPKKMKIENSEKKIRVKSKDNDCTQSVHVRSSELSFGERNEKLYWLLWSLLCRDQSVPRSKTFNKTATSIFESWSTSETHDTFRQNNFHLKIFNKTNETLEQSRLIENSFMSFNAEPKSCIGYIPVAFIWAETWNWISRASPVHFHTSLHISMNI